MDAPTSLHRRGSRVEPELTLALGALGVVFGDIGTSPLYALHAAFASPGHPVAPAHDAVYGVVSLVFWTLTIVVSLKYVTFVMRADNRGEGGIVALTALVQRAARRTRPWRAALALGVFGGALFYGDGMITPAISVLSAVEGLDVAAPGIASFVVPISVAVLVVLFGIQRYGTGVVGLMFGPIMAVWFAAIAAAGLPHILSHPDILAALSPAYGVAFLGGHLAEAMTVLGAVVLTVTGAEALYADMGHFGRVPVRHAWFALVFPALIINYMGQGALVLGDPRAIRNPFFLLVPHELQIPMVVLATVATLIASQAVISGAFSLTHQAVQLSLLPPMTIRHTSEREPRQVYLPAVNWALCVAVAALVVVFGSSTRLAGAYGVAVTCVMAITTTLFVVVVRTRWRRPLPVVLLLAAVFLTVDLLLVAASLTKIAHGGWVPLTVGLMMFTIFTTWRRGATVVRRRVVREEGPLARFVEETRTMDPPPCRAPGTAVFLSGDRETTPLALRENVRHNDVLHRSVIIIFVDVADVPHVPAGERLDVDALGYRDDGITLVTARFGYRDSPSLPRIVTQLARRHPEGQVDPAEVSYFLPRITVVRTGARTMARWRKALFVAMWRNHAQSGAALAAPDDRTVMMGSVIEI